MQIYLKSFVSSPKSANSFSLLPDRDIRSIYQTDKTNFKKEEKCITLKHIINASVHHCFLYQEYIIIQPRYYIQFYPFCNPFFGFQEVLFKKLGSHCTNSRVFWRDSLLRSFRSLLSHL